jgi:integrase/recombinase XerD
MNQTFLKIVQVFKGSPELTNLKKQKSFIELFREFNERDALQNTHKEKTKSKYDNFCDNLELFLKSIRMQDITAAEIDPSIIEDFRHWLHKNLSSCGLTHSSKHLNRCKKVMDYAQTKGIVKYNSISSLKTKRDPVKEIVNLEDNEFFKWKKAIWNNTLYQKTQKLYIFQSTTAISYMDLFNYKTIEVPTKVDDKIIDRLWIESKRGKTNKPYYVPLWHEEFKEALEIHNEYNGKLPFLNNGSYNRYLQEMAAILGIEKHLTTHTGRKTFATTKDANGWDLGAICAVMGNTEAICRDNYIKKGRKKIETQLLKIA